MITFNPLASSSAGCAYHISADGLPPILIDAGIPFKQIQEGIGFSSTELAGCLVSHAHGDHCKAVKQLLRTGVKVYAHPATWLHMGITSPFARIVQPKRQYDVGGWKVTPFEAEHDLEGTLGFIVECGPYKLLYLTDSAYCRYTFEGLTHIFIECNHSWAMVKANAIGGSLSRHRAGRTARTHMSLERLIEMLKSIDLSKVEKIYLLHLSDTNSDEVAFKEAVQKATGVPVYIASKGAGVSI